LTKNSRAAGQKNCLGTAEPFLIPNDKQTIIDMNIRPFIFAFFSAILVTFITFSASARPVPQNLGNGLEKLVESNLLLNAGAPGTFGGYATKQAASYASMALIDKATGRYLVDIYLTGQVPLSTLRSSLQTRFPSLTIKQVDRGYRGVGAIEGYVALNDVPAVAKTAGVSSVVLAIKPVLSVGAVTAQGVNQHRVNQIDTLYNAGATANYDGSGIQIGVISDSFNQAAAASTKAELDTVTGDLPGLANSVNSQPVVVLEDYDDAAGATDEGRGMCQIVHDVAPKSRIGFATAFGGEIGFANNIRALAGLTGFTKDPTIQQGFKGDIVCDDVSYLDEPMFQDGIIAQAVNDVIAAGVTYCSSAANNWGTDGYASTFRLVKNGTGVSAATNSALVNTNINLTGVAPNLYAGGFHNFNPSGKDVAQTVNTGNDAVFVFQWNDAYDSATPTLGPNIFSSSGTSTAGSSVDFTPPAFTAGQEYVITEKATPTTPAENFDAIVAVIDPNGNTILDQDTGVDEVVTFFAPVSGQYTIRVHPYAATEPAYTQGSFSIDINTANGVARVTTDFNILFFDPDGNFIEALGSNNIANNRPIELGSLSFSTSQVQMVISRSNTPTAKNAADQLKYVFFGNGLDNLGPAEYNNYLTPVTFGHSAAAGANSVAAYEVFRPNIPEYFTSPGPVTVYYDANGNRLKSPQVRQKPDIAAADGVNNTFFPIGGIPGYTDSVSDPDTFPNFYGTSAASPHAASLAALVLQAHGGSHSLTPAQVKTIFQSTAFPHDLDPYSASASAVTSSGTVSINIKSDDDINMGTGQNDPNSWTISYTGTGSVTNLSFNSEATPQTGGNTTGGNFNGFTPADFLDPSKYKFTPGMVFASTFLFGNSVGLTQSDVTMTTSNQAPTGPNVAPTAQRFWTLNLAFPNRNFTRGKTLRFNVGRAQQQNSYVPAGFTINSYSADLLGSGLFIPEDPNGTAIQPGMTFRGTIVDGKKTIPFSGRLTNKIGRGYSPLDGYGFINAQAAVSAPAP
jgi:hypothetical protein